MPTPLVSIIMPIRNEAAHLERALDAIDAQTVPAGEIEIIVVDGGSDDDTIKIVERRMAMDSRVRLIGGAGVNTPLAMEMGRDAARAGIIAKIDGHGWINCRFLEVAIACLMREPDIGCVGGRIRPVAESVVERAISIARFSRLGVGGGIYTLAGTAQETDTVQCGVYRRAALEDAGGFDPLLPYGEDEEVNFRVRERGWRIWFQPEMEFAYRVRSSIGTLFRQYFRYGRARVAVVRKHPRFFRLKHALPSLLVAVLTLGFVLMPLPGGFGVGAAIWLCYLAIVGIGSVYLAVRHRFARADLIATSIVALHSGYGLGTIRALVSGRS